VDKHVFARLHRLHGQAAAVVRRRENFECVQRNFGNLHVATSESIGLRWKTHLICSWVVFVGCISRRRRVIFNPQ
jgi:hypothetical protein